VKTPLFLLLTACVLAVTGCTNLSKETMRINRGDTPAQVLAVMGPPDDRQFRGKDEAWQYGQTGAGFGYNDHRVIRFYDGKVIGITSYKSRGTTAGGGMRTINWEERPDATVEVRQR
jgi:hypothetical protein